MERTTFLSSLCIFVLSGVFAQGINPASPAPEFITAVDSIVNGEMGLHNIPGIAIGVVKDGSVVYSKGYGVRDIRSKNGIRDYSVFHTASISKLFTALAVMQLAGEEKVSLDGKLADVAPELKYKNGRAKEITIKQLLNHTSGLPDIHNYHWEYNHQSENSLRDYILGLSLKARPGPSKEYHYSNLGYDLLGYLIEKISGRPFEEYMKNEVLIPFGMTESDFRYFKIPDSLKVSPHSKRHMTQKIYVRKIYPYTREHAPSSTLNASAKDLSIWMADFLDKLKSKGAATGYKAMLEPSCNAYPYIGLGFQLYDHENHKGVGHFGGDKGFRSFLIMLPDENMGLVVLGNGDYHENYRERIAWPVIKLMLTKGY